MAHVLLKAMKHHRDALENSQNAQDVLAFLIIRRKLLHKNLFAERSKEIITWVKLAGKRKIAAALKGNLTRKLVQNSDYIPLPLAVNDLDSPEKLVCSPEGVKDRKSVV